MLHIEELDPDPELDLDPLVRGTDPGIRIQIRIRTKMARIPNTDLNSNMEVVKFNQKN